jgi:uncharacterized protein (DUF2252 family)
MDQPNLTRDERRSYGRMERKRCPRSDLGTVHLAEVPDRVGLIFDQEHDRVRTLLPLRHERMSVSPFTFYRGSAVLMAADLGAGPATKLYAQVCGDAHAANFGVFGSPERRVVFDLNDFDETYRGPFEWDLKRLVVSLLLAAEDAGMKPSIARRVATASLESYTEHMHTYAQMPTLQVWYARLDSAAIQEHLDQRRHAQVVEQTTKARSRSAVRALQKFVTHDEQGEPRFVERPPRLQRVAQSPHAEALMESYLASLPPEWSALMRRYRLRDLAFKAVGVGSVGTRCYVAVLDSGDPADQLLIQLKEANRSVLARHVPGAGPRQQGRRVVVGQKLMQAVGDVLLGWTRNPESGRDYYVRQLWDLKGDLDLGSLDRHGLETHAMLCGWALARAHARTGDPVAMAAYLGRKQRLVEELLRYSEDYLRVVHDDYEVYLKALGELEPLGGTRVELPEWGG